MTLPYNPSDIDSIASYAMKLVDKSFADVVLEKTNLEDRERVITAYGNMARKGGLGNLLERVYFGYAENSNQEADFAEAGLELKVTPYELTSKGEMRAGERVVITMISYDQPFEADLSFMGGPVKTTRYEEIEVEYQDASFKTKKDKFTGFTAQIVQHELDHVNGVLI